MDSVPPVLPDIMHKDSDVPLPELVHLEKAKQKHTYYERVIPLCREYFHFKKKVVYLLCLLLQSHA